MTHTHLPRRLGVHLSGDGVDVAVLASHADQVELSLLDADPESSDGWAERRIQLGGPIHGTWFGHIPGVRAGQHYGFRASGRWDPDAGTRYNPAKLLMDPYTRGVEGKLRLVPAIFGHQVDADGHMSGHTPLPDTTDSRAAVPHSVVIDDHFDAPTVPRPMTPWSDTVIYEAHVRGLTQRMTGIPPELRGTYAGLAHPVMIDHLLSLGVTAVELLPIHASLSELHLQRRGKTNYWAYNTLAFFAPHPGYATQSAQLRGAQAVLAEVKDMVRLLHAAGIEVILDVVYNHTCEGETNGPQLSWRGLDPTLYYLHDGATPARFANLTGCGNTLDFRRPRVVQMALDSLRYWAQEVDVDGFRFDLAVTLGRDDVGFTPEHPFLMTLQTDPIISELKLIAEPWDLGPGGWKTGGFPEPMGEWNDRFRDGARTFWLTDPAEAAHGRPGHGIRELATRLAGSVDLFGHGDPPLQRGVVASINHVTAHDGFTLADLVAYNHKHNQANGEDNQDGSDHSRSWNHGIEGPVPDPAVGAVLLPLRRRSMRNLLGTLILSAGTPMLVAGDEIARTQGGNNNAYCQDNAISWLDWDIEDDVDRKNLLATVQHLLRLRHEHPALRAREFFLGRQVHSRARHGDHRPDLEWRLADGSPLTHAVWHDPSVRSLQMIRTALDGSTVLLLINGSLDPVEFTFGDSPVWHLEWDSTAEHPDAIDSDGDSRECLPGTKLFVEPFSMRVYTSA